MKYKIHFAMLGVVFLALFGLFRSTDSAITMAAPTFTGKADVDFTGPTVIKLNDRATPDVGLPHSISPTDTVKFPTTTISGFDMRAVYLEYDKTTDTMYVGIDCFEICGDADGDGDPSKPGSILQGLSGDDVADFGKGESFGLLIDTDNDYVTSTLTGHFNVVIGVRDDDDLAQIGVYSYTGEIGEQLNNDTWGPKLPFTVTLFAPPSSTTPDLEFSIANFSKLPGFPPGEALQPFKAHAGMGSIVDDGIGEDFLPDQANPIEITPTPTLTPTLTVTATVGTPVPTETSTVTPTLPVTPTLTITPTLTVTPAVTPTATPPAPTSVPTTGADLSMLSAPADIDKVSAVEMDKGVGGNLPLLLPKNELGPERLQIPALGLDTAVADKGWHAVTQQNGLLTSEWDDVRNAAGWHKNSALPGETGNVVLSGHNNMEGAVFRDLYLLKGGETVYIWKNHIRYTYVIDKVKVAPEKYASATQRALNAAYLQPTTEPRLTLITCWPWNGNSHRVFVTAHLDPTRVMLDHRQ